MITLTEHQRVAIVMALLATSVFLTYYFHAILMLGTVFSHFFYIPIIMTALWWEKRSIPVAIFLGGLVVVSSLFYRPDTLTLNDYGRALMFIVIAFVVASLSEQLKKQKQEVEKERDLIRRYLDVAGGLFAAINADHTIQLINRRGCELLGYCEEELIGKDWFATVTPEASRDARRQTFDAAIASSAAIPGRRESPVITRNGEERILVWEDTVLTSDDGRAVGIIGSGSDITERIRVEGKLRAAHEEANLYLDIMEHDINNANAVALGYTDLLTEVLEGRERQMALKLRSGINRSIEIIQNVSTLRRLRSRETVVKPVDLDAVIRAGIAHHPDTRITYEGRPVEVMADDLLMEVFANLIGNAEKFGEPEVEITVRVEGGCGMVEISVEDTGPGVPDSVKPLLFTRFSRGTTNRSGKGLGLYITRMLITRYGGRVWVEDRVPGRPECGAAFRFILPGPDWRQESPDPPAPPPVCRAITARP